MEVMGGCPWRSQGLALGNQCRPVVVCKISVSSKADTAYAHLHLGGIIFHCMVTMSHTNVHPLTGLQEACGNLSVNDRCLGSFNGAGSINEPHLSEFSRMGTPRCYTKSPGCV